ncbi:alpha/beta fold hydrolase [Nocardia sp. NPDC059229]|uniref:alpha/beta fold hydrolase n=1 Tax=Nocardia sp. NPDC059229 TaxID=3346778 RepID=UPI0036BFEFD9
MATFVLVPGAWQGVWTWQSVITELQARGHRAVPAALATNGRTSLATHTAQVADLLDREGPGVVVVGHSYGIFPAVAAADRMVAQVARLVFVDTAIPEDGDSLANLFLDPSRREQLRQASVEGLMPVPAPEELAGPAGLTGVCAADRERLVQLGTPQPTATFFDPVELTGAWRTLPVTGVFCLANGLSLEVARQLYATGAPRFAKFAAADTTFFELPTGHFPMLSTPAELAEVLIRAAAGDGTHLQQAADTPSSR